MELGSALANHKKEQEHVNRSMQSTTLSSISYEKHSLASKVKTNNEIGQAAKSLNFQPLR